MTRTEIMKNNECIGYYGDNYNEICLLGDFMKDKREIKRVSTKKGNCTYITITVK